MGTDGSRWIALAVALGSLSLRQEDASAAPSPLGVQAARELFGEAEVDEDEGRWEAALDKLRRVATVKDTAGVRFHLGLCEEHLGKLVAARADYAASDAQARVEQARDVLRLVGKKLAELERRVAHVTIRVASPAPEVAAIRIDGAPASAGEAVAVDPGTHRVEVDTLGQRDPWATLIAVEEGEAKALDVELPARVRAETPRPAVTPEPPRPATAEPRPAWPPPTIALVEAGSAAALAATGVAAYAAAGSAHAEAVRSCAALAATSPSSCDPYRVPVRAWDWTAIGSWVGAGALATWAVVTWMRAPGTAARVVVGAGSLRVEGEF